MSANLESSASPKLASNSKSWLTLIFGIDARTLAVFRIGLALVLLSDLCTRSTSIAAFYSDSGVLPRSAQIEIYSNLPWMASLHLMSGLVAVQVILFLLNFIAGLALLVGYRTRWATFISWFLLISLHSRNGMTLQGGDVLLRLLLFWSLFLPLQTRLSVDRLLERDDKSENASSPVFLTIGTMAALLQVCFVYWFSYTLKSDISWRSEGSAIYYALNIDQLTRPLGRVLLQYPFLTGSLTAFTMLLERFGPILALLPFWRARIIGVLIFFGFHFGLGICMTLGIFPWIACVAWFLFVPGDFWDNLERFASSPNSLLARMKTSVKRGLQIVATFLVNWGIDSYYTKEDLRRETKSNSLWQNILKQGILSQGIAAIFLVYIFCWNLTTVDSARYGKLIPPGWNALGLATRTDQSWGMFSPFPLRDDGWYVMPARLVNGKEVDLLRDGAPVSWKKPSNVAAMYQDAVWQKYMMNLSAVSNSAHRAYFVGYVTRQWNLNHGPNERIRSLNFVFMLEKTPDFNPSAPYKTDFPTKKLVLWVMKG